MKFFKAAKIRQRSKNILLTIASYRLKNPKAFIIFQSLLIGLITGLISVLLKNIVHITGRELYRNSTPEHPQFLYFAFPGIGIILTLLFLKYFVKDDLSHGISKVLQAISKKHSRIKFHTTFVVDYFMQAPAVLDYYDSFERIMKVFNETQSWNLPVLKDGKFAGIISV